MRSSALILSLLLVAGCTVRFKPPPEPSAGGEGHEAGGEGEASPPYGGEGEGEGPAPDPDPDPDPDPGPCVPTLEICDGVDDDCDGATDEGEDGQPLRRACYGGPPETDGVGECQAGARVCEGGAYDEAGPCPGQVLPAVETGGDDQDEDCDGLVDEGFSTLGFLGQFSSRVTLPAERVLALADTSFTVEAWVRPDELTYFQSNTIMSRRHDDGDGWLFGVAGRGNFDGLAKRAPFFLVNAWPDADEDNAGRLLAAPAQHALRDGVWSHVAVVYELGVGEAEASRVSLYVDGALAVQDDGWDEPPPDTAQIPDAWIGADQVLRANTFDGQIAEVRITAAGRYRQPFVPEGCLTDPEDGPFADAVVAHWRLTEGGGAVALDEGPARLHGEIPGVIEGDGSRWIEGAACDDRGER